jgi:glycosyltransferase involved in cell wall biosynthesis
MYLGKKVSIVFPAYNEELNIRAAIKEFLAHPAVDEVVAVDNNSSDRTAEEIQDTPARYVKETIQGYGAAVRRGLSDASGDIIVTVEPDGTFHADDLDRLLVYSRDYDAVFGTRTSRTPIWTSGQPGVDMYFVLRIGNWAVAKLLEYLFNGPSFTDVGCSYKLIHRHAYEKIKNTFTITGTIFSPEFMMRCLQAGLHVVEIPIKFHTRVGTSKLSNTVTKSVKIGFRMIFFILKERIKTLL